MCNHCVKNLVWVGTQKNDVTVSNNNNNNTIIINNFFISIGKLGEYELRQ